MRLSGALWWFWFVRGYASEGRRWLERVFDLVEHVSAPSLALARPLHGAGLLALFQGDYAAARARLTANAEIWRPLANPTPAGQQARRELAHILVFLALTAHYQSDPAFQSLLAELEPLLGTLDDPATQALILFNRGRGALLQRGDYRAARQPLEQCLRLFRAMGDAWYVAQAAIDLGGGLIRGKLRRGPSQLPRGTCAGPRPEGPRAACAGAQQPWRAGALAAIRRNMQNV